MISIYKQQKEQIRAAIINTAISLFREKGYDHVSIDEITKKVGIAKGTFYNFFPSKKDVLLIWSAQKFQQMQTEAYNFVNSQKTADENMNDLVTMLYRLIEQEQILFFVFIRELTQSNKETRSNGEFDFPSMIQEILSGSADSINIDKQNIDIKVRVINDSLFYEILDWYYCGKQIKDLEKHLKGIVKVCLYGVYKNSD
jgi:AcrR family transcriptional regulator